MAATVTVTDPSGTQNLEVHKSKDDYYAKSSAVEGVHKLTAADLTKFFDKKLDDFRAKKNAAVEMTGTVQTVVNGVDVLEYAGIEGEANGDLPGGTPMESR